MSNAESKLNYCPQNYVDLQDSNGNITDGLWRSDNPGNFTDVSRVGSNFASKSATEIRDAL